MELILMARQLLMVSVDGGLKGDRVYRPADFTLVDRAGPSTFPTNVYFLTNIYLWAYCSLIQSRFSSHTAVHQFVSEMRTNAQQDVSTWRDRSQKMRQEFVDRLSASESTRRLLTDAILHKV